MRWTDNPERTRSVRLLQYLQVYRKQISSWKSFKHYNIYLNKVRTMIRQDGMKGSKRKYTIWCESWESNLDIKSEQVYLWPGVGM